ncbi:putative membrane protein [Wickerhamomyces ciferrii]|uniref:Membrane protein n=1 Tax=Wickerhamomyces ciferrii (strain ATCC 14091 / BCRC 22168 / CBS 111 / JCM 3599 / NBRC 0793 / NRRL Y-1031 F-60-10) TaxID=1206466 RepID=K0KLS5_WICCF|nr:uncharacterized protein BN7_1818 [Wickerhamomyces ciferrii]CCH42274.1 putative membrane protein [Wickerhamomyces ciferrii]
MSESQDPRYKYPPVAPRIYSLVASVVVAIAAGTPYAYSVFAPQLIKNSNLPVHVISNLSLSITLGSSLGGFPAGMIIDKLGPGLADFIGSISTFFAYSLLHTLYQTKSQNVTLFMISLICVGFGSIISFYSTVKVATANFPHHRGTAGSLPVSAYALASLIYSSVSVHFFKDNTSGLLKFLSIFCPAFCFLGSFFLKIYKRERISPSITPPESATPPNLEQQPSFKHVPSTTSLLSSFNDRRYSTSPRASFSLWGIPFRSPRPSLSNMDQSAPLLNQTGLQRSDSMSLYAAVEDTPVFVRENSPIWNHHIVQAICQRLFFKYYLILASLQGFGQAYIYSVGFIVVAQVSSDPDSNLSVGQSQALQVSILAVASFLGRLTSGPISDIFKKQFHAQRIWCIFFAAILMALGQGLTAVFDSVGKISISSFIIGFAFGFVFGTFPAVIADRFGTKGFSTIWGLMTTGGIISVSQLTKIFSYYLGKHTDPDGVCRAGVECYRDTFIITQYGSLFIAALLLFTIYYNNKVGVHQ